MSFETSIEEISRLLKYGNQVIGTGLDVIKLVNSATDLVQESAKLRSNPPVRLESWINSPSNATFEQRRNQKQQTLGQFLVTSGELTCQHKEAGEIITHLIQLLLNTSDPLTGIAVNGILMVADSLITRQAIKMGLTQVDMSVRQGFQQLDAAVRWGFSELMWRVDQQTEVAIQIRDALTKPLDTQSRELRNRAIESYNYGWFDEALTDFLDAMEKSRTDFIVAHYLGNIYLFYKKDHQRAIEYFQKAARFALPKSSHHVAMALMHEGLAHYLKPGENKRIDWQYAAECASRAIKIEPESLELRFQYAQYNALLRNVEETIRQLEYLINRDSRYLLKILAEADFASCAGEVRALITRLHQDMAQNVRHKLLQHHDALARLEANDQCKVLNADYYFRFYYGVVGHHSIMGDNGDNCSISLPSAYRDPQKAAQASYAEAVRSISSLYARGDFFSLREASEQLDKLGSIKITKQIGKVDLIYPYGTRDFEYWGIGGELV